MSSRMTIDDKIKAQLRAKALDMTTEALRVGALSLGDVQRHLIHHMPDPSGARPRVPEGAAASNLFKALVRTRYLSLPDILRDAAEVFAPPAWAMTEAKDILGELDMGCGLGTVELREHTLAFGLGGGRLFVSAWIYVEDPSEGVQADDTATVVAADTIADDTAFLAGE